MTKSMFRLAHATGLCGRTFSPPIFILSFAGPLAQAGMTRAVGAPVTLPRGLLAASMPAGVDDNWPVDGRR